MDATSNPREEIRTFWTGPALSHYEILSLKSLVATGARVLLYSYDDDLDVPKGVELVDANEILAGPVHEFRHANGDTSLALHSDLFRYIALQRFGGWYADLDIICLKRRLPGVKTYFGFMSNRYVNSAILKFPPRTAIMEALMERSWETLPQAGMATTDAARVSVGPNLFRQLISEQAMDHLIQPKSKAYEIGRDEVTAFFDPAQCESTLTRLADSDFTHLWNEEWRMLRIPKNLGPPKGSFLDVMFDRFDIHVSDRARLKPEAIAAWVREHRLLTDIKVKLGVERIEERATEDLAYAVKTFGWEPRDKLYYYWHYAAEYEPPKSSHAQTSSPQVLRSFWHGDSIGPYQLLCLKSFVNHGHTVEIFSYNLKMTLPRWLTLRDAGEILPEEDVFRPIPGSDGRMAINANLFRYAMLAQMGGWWIDPDIMLTKADMPEGDLFFAGLDAFGLVPTSVLKFPAQHPLLAAAIAQMRAFGDDYNAWESAGSGMLTGLVHEHGLLPAVGESLGPISWFDVCDLFDPARAPALIETLATTRFLRLHDDVWRRAGIPGVLAPPEGSALDLLIAQHEMAVRFPARMNFQQVNRWLSHMYKSVQIDRGSVSL